MKHPAINTLDDMHRAYQRSHKTRGPTHVCITDAGEIIITSCKKAISNSHSIRVISRPRDINQSLLTMAKLTAQNIKAENAQKSLAIKMAELEQQGQRLAELEHKLELLHETVQPENASAILDRHSMILSQAIKADLMLSLLTEISYAFDSQKMHPGLSLKIIQQIIHNLDRPAKYWLQKKDWNSQTWLRHLMTQIQQKAAA